MPDQPAGDAVAIADAVARYHELLQDAELAQASQAALDEQLRRRRLHFGDRALCTVLRPRLFTPAGFRLLERRILRLVRAFARVHAAAMTDAALRSQFRLLDWEERLVMADPGFPHPSPHGRLDCFEVDAAGTMALTEYNAETPAGAGYVDLLSEAFATIPVMRRFARDYGARPLPARPGVAAVLLDAWRALSGRWDAPRIAIVDWDDVPTRSEFEIFEAYFASLGLAAEIVDPRALEYRGGRLHGRQGPVDLVYKRVLINELIEREGTDHALVRAVLDRAVCMVNPFRCKLLHKKASLAVLSDERNAGLFEPAELEAIAAHVPWTRVVEPRRTGYRGRSVDLLEFAAANRERLVLKPNDDYGGAGIVLGWTVDDAAWSRALARALAEPSIVQERVTIPSEPYPSLAEGRLHLLERMQDTAPFVVHGVGVEGCLTRLSTAQLLNVTAGGGSTVPCFLIEPRPA